MIAIPPAVTFTIEGSGVNLHGETGLEVPQDAKQDENYASAIDKLVLNSALREQYAEAAHKRVAENFLMQHMVSAMENVYKEL